LATLSVTITEPVETVEMNNFGEVKERYQQIYPGFGSYTECMSRALFSGLSGTIFGFASTFYIQSTFQKKLPYSPKGNIIVSSVAAILIGYKVTSSKARACQAGWLAGEEKHTYFTENESKSQDA